MRRTALCAMPVLMLALTARVGFAQDPTAVDTDHYTVEFENDYVRVLRIHYGPDEISVMHKHPAAVFVPLTAGNLKMRLPDGSEADVAVEAGVPVWAEPTTHQPHNLRDGTFEGILIELKEPSHKTHE